MDRPAPLELPFRPRKAILFSGHRIDTPGRSPTRFPAASAAGAAARMAQVLAALEAGPEDVGLTQGAAGGDVLFAECCLAHGVPFRLLLPLPQASFIAESILPSADGPRWKERFLALTAAVPQPVRSLPEVEGDPFEACNHWLLDTALASGAAELHLIALWDGSGGDGPGGTSHLLDEVRQAGGQITWIDTRSL